jgi:hypothetical protein
MTFDLSDPAQRRDYFAALTLQTYMSAALSVSKGNMLPLHHLAASLSGAAYEAADALEAARNEVKK